MSQIQENLTRLTLRQLRLKASELGVPLYSRKNKSVLIREIETAQKKMLSIEEKSESKPGFFFSSKPQTETRVVFLPRDTQWAYVFWEISESDRKRAQLQGANRLILRLSDVTGQNNKESLKGAVQEVQVDSHSTEWYLPIPLSNRDYQVELGYRSGRNWISLAISSSARVPALHPSDQILDQFVPFSLEASSGLPQISSNLLLDPVNVGLHERLYQSATTHFNKLRIGSEEFQEDFSMNQELNESGIGLWASGRNESGIGGVQPRQSTFWLVADAELIVYGSTDPSATLMIGDEKIPLSSDGTFRLQVPFRDGLQNYPIKATLTEGGQSRNITMHFERKTLEDNTNPKDEAKAEWF